MERLDEDRIAERLEALNGWSREGDEITRTYRFRDFSEAMTFVRRVAELAEAADHHPDIDIRYDHVRLGLSTHSAGGLTRSDFDLAERIDASTTG